MTSKDFMQHQFDSFRKEYHLTRVGQIFVNFHYDSIQIEAAKHYLSLCRKRDEMRQAKQFPYIFIAACIAAIILALTIKHYVN